MDHPAVDRSRRSNLGGVVSAFVLATLVIAGCAASISSRGDDFTSGADESIDTAPDSVSAATSLPRRISGPTTSVAASAADAVAVPTNLAVVAGTPQPPSVEVAAEPAALAYQPPAAVAVPILEFPLEAIGQNDGEETARLQARLLELGFWVQATDGDYGLTTTQAVMAAQKYYGLTASGSVDEATVAVLSGATERANGAADAGTLVEIDKSKQLLFLVTDGTTTWVLNASTGSEVPYEAPNKNDPLRIERGDAVTPVGLFHVNRERPDGWWEGDLGEIYRPKYFVGGIAIHGSNSIPNVPASHGCVRVSVPAMDWIWDGDLVPIETPVWVHGEIPII